VGRVAFVRRRKRRAPHFVAALVVFAIQPNHIAHQDLGGLLAQQAGVAERARSFFVTTSFATLRTATFMPSRPIGSTIPTLWVHFNPDITGSIPRNINALDWTGFDGRNPDEYLDVPVVNRTLKGDQLRLINLALPPADPVAPPAPVASARLSPPLERERPVPNVELFPAPDLAPVLAERPAPNVELVPVEEIDPAIADATVDRSPQIAAGLGPEPEEFPRADMAGSIFETVPTEKLPSWSLYRVSRLIFGTDDGILPPSAFEHRGEIKLAALPNAATESVAPKGVVTGDDKRPRSPAEQLRLSGPARAKAEKCLAEAVYFESRGEPERGQIAVAQVVVNRAFSGYYPADICGVVYQNAHRHLACQFTFACDSIPDRVTEPEPWERAKRIARDMLDGKAWLAEVGKATHYHAYWVRPAWIREMRVIQRIGVHTFYRPRKWEQDG
jgi:spore germination cell wall hydrolase CwlJ-like protein